MWGLAANVDTEWAEVGFMWAVMGMKNIVHNLKRWFLKILKAETDWAKSYYNLSSKILNYPF